MEREVRQEMKKSKQKPKKKRSFFQELKYLLQHGKNQEVEKLIARIDKVISEVKREFDREYSLVQQPIMDEEGLCAIQNNWDFHKKVLGKKYDTKRFGYDWGILISKTQSVTYGRPALVFRLVSQKVCRAGPKNGLRLVRFNNKTALILIHRDWPHI